MTSKAISKISGKAMKKATVDLRCMALRKPVREPVVATSRGAEIAASTIVCLSIHQAPAPRPVCSRPHKAFQLAFGPGQRLLHRLALVVTDGHLGHETLHVDLHGNLVRRGSRRD